MKTLPFQRSPSNPSRQKIASVFKALRPAAALALGLPLFAGAALAQTPTETPRQIITKALGLDGNSPTAEQITGKPLDWSETVSPSDADALILKPETIEEPEIIDALEATYAELDAEESSGLEPSDPETSDPNASELESSDPRPDDAETLEAEDPIQFAQYLSADADTIAPFYLSAPEYLARRLDSLGGDDMGEHMVLEYEVTRSAYDAKTEAAETETKDKSQTVRLTIGNDFAAETRGAVTKIYDFALNRLLTIKPANGGQTDEDAALIFDNTSLYAIVQRNLLAVEQVTQNGKVRSIDIGGEKALNAFWVESAMSISTLSPKGLILKPGSERISARLGSVTAAQAQISETDFPSEGHAKAMQAYAFYALPLHPNIINALSAWDAPPTSLSISSFGPSAPGGEIETWALVSALQTEAPFPLPQTALSAPERKPLAPIVFVINQAARNEALGGINTPQEIGQAALDALEADDSLSGWIAAQRYSGYTGVCSNQSAVSDGDSDPVCEALRALETRVFFNSLKAMDADEQKLSDFVTGYKMSSDPKTAATGLKTLIPYASEEGAPAPILRAIGSGRTKLSAQAAASASLSTVTPMPYLFQALATDPYNPQTYVKMGALMMDSASFEEAWDVLDAMRAGLPTGGAAQWPDGQDIDGREESLRKRAPGFFAAFILAGD